jgi:hypothetical protein
MLNNVERNNPHQMFQEHAEMAAGFAGSVSAVFVGAIKSKLEAAIEIAIGGAAAVFLIPGACAAMKIENPHIKIAAGYLFGLLVYGVVRQVVKARNAVGVEVTSRLLSVIKISPLAASPEDK